MKLIQWFTEKNTENTLTNGVFSGRGPSGDKYTIITVKVTDDETETTSPVTQNPRVCRRTRTEYEVRVRNPEGHLETTLVDSFGLPLLSIEDCQVRSERFEVFGHHDQGPSGSKLVQFIDWRTEEEVRLGLGPDGKSYDPDSENYRWVEWVRGDLNHPDEVRPLRDVDLSGCQEDSLESGRTFRRNSVEKGEVDPVETGVCPDSGWFHIYLEEVDSFNEYLWFEVGGGGDPLFLGFVPEGHRESDQFCLVPDGPLVTPIVPGWLTRGQFVHLLRRYRSTPKVIEFLSDCLEE